MRSFCAGPVDRGREWLAYYTAKAVSADRVGSIGFWLDLVDHTTGARRRLAFGA